MNRLVRTLVTCVATTRLRRRLPMLLLGVALLASCDRNLFYADDCSVDEEGWNLQDQLFFELNDIDTTRIYDFYLDLRISTDYPYSNAFLFITTQFPDGGVAQDTLECPLAAPDGSWYGKRSGQYVDNRYYFRKAVIFPSTGPYHFSITHGMRDTSIVGIKDVGIRVEYAK